MFNSSKFILIYINLFTNNLTSIEFMKKVRKEEKNAIK